MIKREIPIGIVRAISPYSHIPIRLSQIFISLFTRKQQIKNVFKKLIVLLLTETNTNHSRKK